MHRKSLTLLVKELLAIFFATSSKTGHCCAPTKNAYTQAPMQTWT